MVRTGNIFELDQLPARVASIAHSAKKQVSKISRHFGGASFQDFALDLEAGESGGHMEDSVDDCSEDEFDSLQRVLSESASAYSTDSSRIDRMLSKPRDINLSAQIDSYAFEEFPQSNMIYKFEMGLSDERMEDTKRLLPTEREYLQEEEVWAPLSKLHDLIEQAKKDRSWGSQVLPGGHKDHFKEAITLTLELNLTSEPSLNLALSLLRSILARK